MNRWVSCLTTTTEQLRSADHFLRVCQWKLLSETRLHLKETPASFPLCRDKTEAKTSYLHDFPELTRCHFCPQASPSFQLQASMVVHMVHLEPHQTPEKHSVQFFKTKHFSHQGVSFIEDSVYSTACGLTPRLRESVHLNAVLLPWSALCMVWTSVSPANSYVEILILKGNGVISRWGLRQVPQSWG